jgi:glyoxylase-like metal-dependent hydrolase (beta-lactamase superfamily II)
MLVLLAMATAIASSGQVRPAEAVFNAQLVKTGLYLISGGGINSLLRLSANGIILVDGKLPGNYRAFMSQVRSISKISDLPVRFLVLTDHHEESAGNNSQFVDAGVRIIGHKNVQRHLAAQVAPPAITYDTDHTLRLGGIEVRLIHPGNAHTDGDTVVYFPNLKVVAVGELYAATPNPDFAAGGSLVNWGPALAEILKLDFDKVVPASGPPVSRSDFIAFKSKIDTVASRATRLVEGGVPRDQLMARLKTDDLGWRFDFTGDRLNRFYAELLSAK